MLPAAAAQMVWVDAAGQVRRYYLAYINHGICGVDNGRVVGYDNVHGYHHRHLMGHVEPIEFVSYRIFRGKAFFDVLMEARAAEQAMPATISRNAKIMKAFGEAGLLTAWLVGRIAYGVKLEAAQALDVQVLLASSKSPSVVDELLAVMENALGRVVTVCASFNALRRPEVGIEIVLTKLL